MKKFGIDVSKWQGNFDFKQAKSEGVEFVILRGAYSTFKDGCFERYYNACKSLEIPVGCYHYSMARSVSEARREANFLIDNVLKGKQFEYPIYMDVEDKVQRDLGKDLLTDIVIIVIRLKKQVTMLVYIHQHLFSLLICTKTSLLSMISGLHNGRKRVHTRVHIVCGSTAVKLIT